MVPVERTLFIYSNLACCELNGYKIKREQGRVITHCRVKNMKGGKMRTTGEEPREGTYYCCKCGQVVTLDDDTDSLPHRFISLKVNSTPFYGSKSLH